MVNFCKSFFVSFLIYCEELTSQENLFCACKEDQHLPLPTIGNLCTSWDRNDGRSRTAAAPTKTFSVKKETKEVIQMSAIETAQCARDFDLYGCPRPRRRRCPPFECLPQTWGCGRLSRPRSHSVTQDDIDWKNVLIIDHFFLSVFLRFVILLMPK